MHGWPQSPAQQDPNPVQAFLEAVQKHRDELDVERIAQVAALRTREAALALVEAFDTLGNLALRLEILSELAGFDGVATAEQPALEALAQAATMSSEEEITSLAVDLLAKCPRLGRHYLERIVQSNALGLVRERALRRHVEGATDKDQTFYRSVFTVDLKARERAHKSAQKASKSAPKVPYVAVSTALRELALEQLAPKMAANELIGLAREKERDPTDLRKDGIRRIALLELRNRGEGKARDVALQVFEDKTEKAHNRALAAEMLVAFDGPKVAPRLIEEGLKDASVVPIELRSTMADLLAGMEDKALATKLWKLLEKSDPQEQEFLLRALGRAPNPKLDERLIALLKSNASSSQWAALDSAQARRLAGAVEPALDLVRSSKDEALAARALDCVAGILEPGTGRTELLLEFARSDREQVCHAALKHLLASAASDHEEVFLRALESPSWSVRSVALEALMQVRTKAAVGAIIARLGQESGLMKKRCAEALWQLTGQPLRSNETAWKAWWQDAEATFVAADPAQISRLAAQEKQRLLGQSTKASKFFGVTLESTRVIFIIDISGSMNEQLPPKFVGEEGAVRFEVAKQQLLQAIDGLDPSALFNILVFSDGIHAWNPERVAPADDVQRESAKEFVKGLAPLGGTNVYGALQAAFLDPDVDTIVMLSDGQPSTGQVIDERTIREHVAQWNLHRGVVVHTVAVGERLRLMEWLAQDSNGTHVLYE